MSSAPAGATVLLYMVDPNASARLRAQLEDHRICVVPVLHMDDVQRSLLLHRGALYLLEVHADDQLGIEMIQEIRQRDSLSSIVVLSAESEPACRQAARDAGASDFLATPVRDLDLDMCLGRYPWLADDASPTPPGDEPADERPGPRDSALGQARKAELAARALAETRSQELVALEFRNQQLQRQNEALLAIARSKITEPAPSVSGDEPRSDIDELTGLLSEGPLQDHLDREYSRSRRYGHALSVLLIDVDRLGKYCKRHGDEAGDSALCLVADVLRSALRTPDIVARQGSDAFVILATDTTEDEAMQLGNRLRTALAQESQHGSLPGVTVSIGIASAKRLSVTRSSDLLAAAERAMAEAKSGGRDRCCIAVA